MFKVRRVRHLEAPEQQSAILFEAVPHYLFVAVEEGDQGSRRGIGARRRPDH
jgi:hypothetical protein